MNLKSNDPAMMKYPTVTIADCNPTMLFADIDTSHSCKVDAQKVHHGTYKPCPNCVFCAEELNRHQCRVMICDRLCLELVSHGCICSTARQGDNTQTGWDTVKTSHTRPAKIVEMLRVTENNTKLGDSSREELEL